MRATFAGALVFILATLDGSSASARPRASAALPQNPAPTATVRIPPSPVEGDDGRRYLLYELHIRGLGRRSVESIEVFDAEGTEVARRRVLAEYGAELLERTVFDFIIDYDRRFFYDSMGRAASFRLGGGGERMAYLAVAITSDERMPSRLAHRIGLLDGDSAETIVTGEVDVLDAPTTIAPPLRGRDWLARGTIAREPTPHRLSLVRHLGEVGVHDRFAIDFTRVDSTGKGYRTDGTTNEDFLAWDADVLAVADGVVVAAVDGMPDNDPSASARAVEITKETLGGNHVILDLGAGRYAVYVHLRNGSLAVAEGDRVRAGTRLGALGNSGNSNEPHLHFAVASEPSVIAGEGLPFVFDRFTTLGHCEPTGEGWSCEPRRRSEHQNRLPLTRRVVAFR